MASAENDPGRASFRTKQRARTATDDPRSPKSANILLKAAFELFARQSYSSVTIKNISDATGFNASLIYYYYENKENLFTRAIEATVQEAFEHFENILQRAVDPVDIISLWIELHIEQYIPLQKLAKISLDYASTVNRQFDVDAAISEFYERENSLLCRAIREGIASGTFRTCDPAATAQFISTFLDGSLFRKVMFPDFDQVSAIRHMRTLVIEHLSSDSFHPLPRHE